MAFSDFCLRSSFEAQPLTQGHTNKPTWQNSTCFSFNKASGWNSCPFRWNQEETAGTRKLFSTLRDILILEVTKDILFRPAKYHDHDVWASRSKWSCSISCMAFQNDLFSRVNLMTQLFSEAQKTGQVELLRLPARGICSRCRCMTRGDLWP